MISHVGYFKHETSTDTHLHLYKPGKVALGSAHLEAYHAISLSLSLTLRN